MMDSDTALTVIAWVLLFFAVLTAASIAFGLVLAVGAAILQERERRKWAPLSEQESREKPDGS